MVNVCVVTNRCASICRLQLSNKLRFQYIKPLSALSPKSTVNSGSAVNSIAAAAIAGKSIAIVSTSETLFEDSFDEEDIDNYRCVIPALGQGTPRDLNLTTGINMIVYPMGLRQ